MIKKLIILGLITVISLLFWASAIRWVSNPDKLDWKLLTLAFLSFIILSVLIGLSFILFRDEPLKLLVSFIVGVIFVIGIGFNQFTVGSILVILLLHLWAIKLTEREKISRVKFDVGYILRRNIPMIMTPILILVSFAYFLSPAVQASKTRQELPESFQKGVDIAIEQFLAKDIGALPPEEQEEVRGLVLERLTGYAQPFFKFFPPLLAFGLFLILQGLKFILVFLAVVLGKGLFILLKRLGFIKITTAQIDAETLVLI